MPHLARASSPLRLRRPPDPSPQNSTPRGGGRRRGSGGRRRTIRRGFCGGRWRGTSPSGKKYCPIQTKSYSSENFFRLQQHRKLHATAAVRVPRGLRRRPAKAPASPGVAWRWTHLDDLSQAGVTGHTVECRLGEGKEASSLRHQRLVSYFRCWFFGGKKLPSRTLHHFLCRSLPPVSKGAIVLCIAQGTLKRWRKAV